MASVSIYYCVLGFEYVATELVGDIACRELHCTMHTTHHEFILLQSPNRFIVVGYVGK